MRKFLLWLTALGAVVGFLLYRRRLPEPEAEGAATGADPAEELRRKLQQTRERASEPEPGPLSDVDLRARRREVHARGRTAADEMRDSTAD